MKELLKSVVSGITILIGAVCIGELVGISAGYAKRAYDSVTKPKQNKEEK